MGIYASDCETTGLLEQMALQANPKLHNLCSIDIASDDVFLFEGKQRGEIQDWLDQGHTFITHNCYTYDMPALEMLGYDVSKTKWIDSLALSWYLSPTRLKHGLASWGADFGVPKPEIDNWEEQTQEEYNHRVLEDCRIQKKLWLHQVARLKELYGSEPGSFDKLIAFLMWKMQQQRIQQDTRFQLDVPEAEKLQEHLRVEIEKKTDALRLVMPKVPVYVVRGRPQKPFKKSGDLSAGGEKWKELTESLGLPFEHEEDIKVVKEYKEGNPGSHQQIKDWLFALSWSPLTFKYVREDNGEVRQIPQVNLKGGLVCDSVLELIPKCQGIEHIAGLGILNHRYSVVSGFLRDAVDGELSARCQGFTNTLRLQHKEIVNLPSLRVQYGKDLRGLLVAKDGKILCGSDLSSLEDRLKHHFQWKLDPEYVKSQMTKGFDPHNAIAVSAGLMSQDEANFYSWYKENHG